MKTVIFIISLLFLAGCAKKAPVTDERLSAISLRITDDVNQSKAALAALDSIEPATLSEFNRHLLDFLKIKAADKAYIAPSSDSLILDVVEYFKGTDLYPEALYYEGRTYVELGDCPRALDAFQLALTELKGQPTTSRLRSRIVSQTGRLMINLRMYSEAQPYLKEAIKNNVAFKDTFNLIYNYSLLSETYKFKKTANLDSAAYFINEALKLSKSLTEYERNDMFAEMADIKNTAEDLPAAQQYISFMTLNQDSLTCAYNYTIAAEIYFRSGNFDSAFYYAKKVLDDPSNYTKSRAYEILLYPEMTSFSTPKELGQYALQLSAELNKQYNQNDANSTIVQNSLFNHSKSDAIALKEFHRGNRYKSAFIVAIIIAVIIICALAGYVKRLKTLPVEHAQEVTQPTPEDVPVAEYQTEPAECPHEIQQPESVEQPHDKLETQPEEAPKDDIRIEQPTYMALIQARKALQQRLGKITKSEKYKVHEDIRKTDAYRYLNDLIKRGKGIPRRCKQWDELYEMVLAYYPTLKPNFELLGGDSSGEQFKIVMLVKLGFSQYQIDKLNNTSSTHYHIKGITKELLGDQFTDTTDRMAVLQNL